MKLCENPTEVKQVLKIRTARYNDQFDVLDCDLKCFDYPYDSDAWEFVEDCYNLKVATLEGKIVGFTIYYYDDGSKLAKVPKVAVKPDYRRNKVGTLLLAQVNRWAKGTPAKQMEMILPESFLNPDDPIRDCTGWLRATHWKAEGVAKSMFQDLGHRLDGIRFIRNVL